ncbi:MULTISPECIES: ABC transporter ATP-binding protein [unclassified Enterococcus]|uniref:ABC transporter ATP-binding protein n=1 Tax=unclassified Enterococcus TaxID=2608891 RepID=UPI001556F85A|nr:MULTISPECIES: ABC transporter ATP-binding protein [unclassified Enterococcus]MBS7576767.1 ABC transporter ATP-binding protein [Enterococcus sp. MMGLQ5-2]MBS7583746.1 ABC transporter ATP-binding protein [Enterococcus sp. MMGLQ5-1]NPD11607.1 ABC transporter ATP-binding protein [Enterococcus sp. MMGLQ5-1]NPD36604.1 ABC transporter ATP-binding protein [Enterococcus sp. MMGLQ5-2]
MKEIIKLNGINKKYGDVEVIKRLNMTIQSGEFLTMLGPSGCGKTTTLRMIAGFESPTSGEIFLEEESVAKMPPYKRQVNTVFQSYALFPHMTIAENIGFGLKMSKVARAEINERVEEMLQLVQLEGYGNRKIDQLSGGQKQRVAIARALINRPKVLLLDEPLSALDLKLRKQMQLELKRLQRKLNITFIYVTHDQEEALTMSDRIAIMNQGNLEQLDTPKAIYDHPASKFVADFIGESNIFYGAVENSGGTCAKIQVEAGQVLVQSSQGIQQNEIIYLSVRPEKIKVSTEQVAGFSLFGKISEHYFTGSMNKSLITLTNGLEIKMNYLSEQKLLPVGEKVYVYWNPEDAMIIPSVNHDVFEIIDNPDFSSVNQK